MSWEWRIVFKIWNLAFLRPNPDHEPMPKRFGIAWYKKAWQENGKWRRSWSEIWSYKRAS